MLTDIIIIIPTHKRQHYLNRVAWYYSHFDMKVYICDSTPGTSFNIDKYDYRQILFHITYFYQIFGNLYCIKSCAFTYLVATKPESKSVFIG